MAQIRTEVFETPVGHCIRLTVATGVVAVAVVLSAGDAGSLTALLAEASSEAAAKDIAQKAAQEATQKLTEVPVPTIDASDAPAAPALTLVGSEKERGH